MPVQLIYSHLNAYDLTAKKNPDTTMPKMKLKELTDVILDWSYPIILSALDWVGELTHKQRLFIPAMRPPSPEDSEDARVKRRGEERDP